MTVLTQMMQLEHSILLQAYITLFLCSVDVRIYELLLSPFQIMILVNIDIFWNVFIKMTVSCSISHMEKKPTQFPLCLCKKERTPKIVYGNFPFILLIKLYIFISFIFLLNQLLLVSYQIFWYLSDQLYLNC